MLTFGRELNKKGFAPIFVVLIVAIALVIGGGVLYYAKRSSAPKPVACTQEAKQCPDGKTYVGRTGPNCEFAACPELGPCQGPGCGSTVTATSSVDTSTWKTYRNKMITGTLTGKVSIGPICPVERVGVPCPVPPETYTSREFLVLSSDQKKTIASFHADAQGNYSVSLSPGVYTVVSAKTGIGFLSKDLPSAVAIKAGKTTNLNISVDTGIR